MGPDTAARRRALSVRVAATRSSRGVPPPRSRITAAVGSWTSGNRWSLRVISSVIVPAVRHQLGPIGAPAHMACGGRCGELALPIAGRDYRSFRAVDQLTGRRTMTGGHDRRCGIFAATVLVAGVLAAPLVITDVPGAAALAVRGTGTATDLGTLGGSTGVAFAINEQGQVAGTAETADGGAHAFRWTASGGMQALGTLQGATFSDARVINARGQVAGMADTADGATHAFRWTESGGMEDLGTLGGTFSFLGEINEQGQISGSAQMADGATHAFRWTESG